MAWQILKRYEDRMHQANNLLRGNLSNMRNARGSVHRAGEAYYYLRLSKLSKKGLMKELGSVFQGHDWSFYADEWNADLICDQCQMKVKIITLPPEFRQSVPYYYVDDQQKHVPRGIIPECKVWKRYMAMRTALK
jgi:hypothetical protein